jgi:hypothetical protein
VTLSNDLAREPERGIAIFVAVLALALVSALAAAMTLTTSSEALIAGSFRDANQAFYAADSAAEWAAAELAAIPNDWGAVAAGARQSAFLDGAVGPHTLPNGEPLDLVSLVLGNPGWSLYAYGPLNGLLPPSAMRSPHYIVVFAAADPAGPERVKIRAISCGPRGGRRVVELVLVKGPAGVRTVAWELGR